MELGRASIKAFILGLFSAVLTTVLLAYTHFASPFPNKASWPFPLIWYYTTEDGIISRNFYFAAVLFMLYPVLFNALLPKRLRLNSWELAIVSAMMMPVLMVTGSSDGGFLASRTISMMYAGLASDITRDYVIRYASPLFGPKDIELLRPIVTGGASVPWDKWALPILWYMIFYTSFYAILLFIGSLVRRLWIEIESLPFPLVSPCTTLIIEVSADKPSDIPSILRSRWLWIGFILALVLFIVNGATDFIPGFPPWTPSKDLTPLAITTGVFVFPFNPLALGLGSFLPYSVLLTTVVTYILLFMILPAVLWVPIGWLDPLPPGRHCWWTWNRFIGKFEFTPASPLSGGYMSFAWGLIFGLALYPLFTNWRYFKEIAVGFLGRKVRGEEKEAFPYRIAWLGVILSSLVYVLALYAVNVPIQYGLLQLIIVIPFWVGLMRYTAEAGFGLNLIGGWSEWTSILYQFSVPWAGLDKAPGIAAPWMATTFMWTNTCWGAGGNMYSNAYSLDPYKLASLHGVNNRSMFVSIFASIVVSIAVGIITYLTLAYSMGTAPSRVPIVNNLFWYFSYRPVVEGVLHNPVWNPNERMLANAIFGFIFPLILYYLKIRVGGIFNYASAAGILVALNAGLNVWISFLLILIIKILLEKIGGIPLQRKIVIPFGLGIFIAGALWLPLHLALNWIAVGRWI